MVLVDSVETRKRNTALRNAALIRNAALRNVITTGENDKIKYKYRNDYDII